MNEVWKIIDTSIEPKIFPNLYEVSNYGNIRNIKTGKVFKTNRDSVSMYGINKEDRAISIARLVYKAFIDNSLPDYKKIAYKDNNKNNYYYKNLYAVTKSEYKNIEFENNAKLNSGLSNREMSSKGYYQNNSKIMCYYIDEEWKDITQDHVQNIKPWYLVSNYGRIYSKATNSIIKSSIINSGYERVQLMSINNGKIDLLVHRIVAMVWIPIDNYNELEVNHKNENTFDNRMCNLEWVTPIQNLQYKANVKRTIYYNQTFSNEIVKSICEALQNKMSYQDICFYILHCNYDCMLHRRLWLIHKHKIHTEISKNYDF
jgi:hypothetical protein